MKKEDVDNQIVYNFDRIKELVLEKNNEYNNSLQNPISVFSNTPMYGILGRIDDKIGRIKSAGVNDNTLDTIDDLIGYLVHLRIMYENNQK